jgi:Mrp family chromosome partitioning ATPase
VVNGSLRDGVFLVVQGGKTSRQVVKRTRQLMFDVGAKIIGVVLNKIDVRAQEYYYYNQNYKDYYGVSSNGESDFTTSVTSIIHRRSSNGQ